MLNLQYNHISFDWFSRVGTAERRKACYECSEQPINQFAWHSAMWWHLNQTMSWMFCEMCPRLCHTQHAQLWMSWGTGPDPGRKAEPPFPPSPSCCGRAVAAGCFHGSAVGIPFPLSIPGAPCRGWSCSAPELLPRSPGAALEAPVGWAPRMGRNWRSPWNRVWELAFFYTLELHFSSIQSMATSNCIDTANLQSKQAK